MDTPTPTLSGVTLFDQHLVDTLAFTLHGNGFSIEHTDGAQIPAFDVSGDLNPSGKGFRHRERRIDHGGYAGPTRFVHARQPLRPRRHQRTTTMTILD